ncbi:uncharacterized protein BDW47DRAFT_63268 [Aspergillus candidus]|uniref:Uncharacterized protein n=1 Tax=Aspergillus candidus TaxID=41067 RepID=A0A2I2F421_ASPCN|nr:hypothetical protein BDW47DRAFT_63268 [Aspergillus candidus]PLB35384.1 hypothetical protein BDW47DRAFT_63268 [Aspergillus candidus]
MCCLISLHPLCALSSPLGKTSSRGPIHDGSSVRENVRGAESSHGPLLWDPASTSAMFWRPFLQAIASFCSLSFFFLSNHHATPANIAQPATGPITAPAIQAWLLPVSADGSV